MDTSKCFVCGETFRSVLRHLANASQCKNEYPPQILTELKNRIQSSYAEKDKLHKKNTYDSDKERKRKQTEYHKDAAKKRNRIQTEYHKDALKQRNRKQTEYHEDAPKQRNRKQTEYHKDAPKQRNRKQTEYHKDAPKERKRKQTEYHQNSPKEKKRKQSQYQQDQYVKKEIMQSFNPSAPNYKNFFKEIQFGPIFPCICCMRCFTDRGVKVIDKHFHKNLIDTRKLDCIDTSESLKINDKFHLCHTCHLKLSKGQMPKLCFQNGLKLSKIPDCMQISSLGNQLLAKYILFLKLREHKKSGFGILNDRVRCL